jgi:hypothetical protein
MVIIDEISMIDSDTLRTIDRKLRGIGEIGEFYGAFHMVFVGDFRQLDPINEDKAIYKQIMFSEWTIAINAYLELNGMFRYKEDPASQSDYLTTKPDVLLQFSRIFATSAK